MKQAIESTAAVTHPAPELLIAFGRGTVDDEDLCIIEEHLEHCQDCCRFLDRASQTEPFLEGLLHAARETSSHQSSEGNGSQTTPNGEETAVDREIRKESRLPEIPGYQLQREMGRGGAGVVYKARHIRLNRIVAVKMLLSGSHASPAELARFRIEAETIARLQHPNIVQIHEVGTYQDMPFLVLEFMEGGTLEARLMAGNGSIGDFRTIASFLQTLARAVQFAHDRGVIHRDLKPANILLSAGAREPGDDQVEVPAFVPKISDFGLARWQTDGTNLTRTGVIAGTPSYMAPEQAGGHTGDLSSPVDIYGLGAILYEMLTGRPPFESLSPLETIRQVCNDEPPHPRILNRRVHPDLATICLKCLEKLPRRRFPSAGDLADDLDRFLRGEPVRARPIGTLEKAWRWCSRNVLAASLMAAVLIALVCGVVVSGYFAFTASAEAAVALQEKERAETMAQRARSRAYGSDMRMAQRAWDDDVTGLFYDMLDRQRPDQTDGVDGRGFEWYYWSRRAAAASISATIGRHATSVIQVAYSPDGGRVASAGGDHLVKVWDARGGKQELNLQGHTKDVRGVCFSPDGKWIASASSDGTARVWDARTGRMLHVLLGHADAINGVSFSPDSKQIATAGSDNTARIWDARTGRLERSLHGHTDSVNSVCFSPDGKCLATAGFDRTVRIWNAVSGQELRTVRGHTTYVTHVCFSADGERLASCSDCARIWKSTTGEELVALKTGKDGAVSACFSPDGSYLVTSGSDQTIKVWDSMNGQLYLTLRGHEHQVPSVCYSPDGKQLASGGFDSTVRTWDVSSALAALRWSGHHSQVTGLAASPQGRWMASTGGNWDRNLYRYTQGELLLWDSVSGGPRRRIERPSGFTSLTFSPDGHYLACGTGDWDEAHHRYRSGEIQLWDPDQWVERGRLQGHSSTVMAVAFSPDSQFLASGGMDGSLLVRRLPDGAEGFSLPGLSKAITTLAFSPDGRYLAGGGFDAVVKIWDLSLRSEVATLPASAGATCVAFSPDGKQLAISAYVPDCVLYDAVNWQEIHRLQGHLGSVTHVAFSPDGSRLVTSSEDQTVRLWDSASGHETLVFRGHTDIVRSVCFSSDSQRLFSGGWDFDIRVWDATPLKEDKELDRQSSSP